MSPIQLTEQWLIDFGFEKIMHKYSLNDSSLTYHYELNNNKDWMLYFLKDGRFAFNDSKPHKPQYLHNRFAHQLQNLYFALTGEELTLNNLHNK